MATTLERTKASKYRTVRDSLERAIHDGEFAVGEQLPAEQTIAARFAVSHMTARRAICELVEADILERRSNNGTYVRNKKPQQAQTAVLNLITFTYDAAAVRDFLNCGAQLAEMKGWHANTVLLAKGQQDPAVRAIRTGGYSIVMLDDIYPSSALGQTICAARDRTISIQCQRPELGVPCVLYDEAATINLAMDRLLASGHQDVALVAQVPTIESSRTQIAVWRERLAKQIDDANLGARLVEVRTPRYQSPASEAYAAVRAFLASEARSSTVTGIICLGDEITHGALAACRDANRPVPNAISLINIVDAPLLALAHPPVTSVDIDYKRQLEIAIHVLERPGSARDKHTVHPRIVERDSVSLRRQ